MRVPQTVTSRYPDEEWRYRMNICSRCSSRGRIDSSRPGSTNLRTISSLCSLTASINCETNIRVSERNAVNRSSRNYSIFLKSPGKSAITGEVNSSKICSQPDMITVKSNQGMTVRYEFTIDSTYIDQSPRTSVIIAVGDLSWIAAIGRTSGNEDSDGVATYTEADNTMNIFTAGKRI